MVLITGGSGSIGQALLRELRAAGIPARVVSRDPDKARARLGAEVDVVPGHFGDPRSMAAALAGVDALFLLVGAGPWIVDHDAAWVRAVAGTGVRRIVKLSSLGADWEQPLLVSRWHRSGEEAVRQSGLPWTLLRPAGFASNALGWASHIRAGSALQLGTGDGRQAIVDPGDVAAVAARGLATDEQAGRAYTLTGPELLSAPEQVELIGRALGRTIAVEQVTPESVAERYRAAGMPAEFVAAVREGHEVLRAGLAAVRTDDVERVLGRPARPFTAWVADHLEQFR